MKKLFLLLLFLQIFSAFAFADSPKSLQIKSDFDGDGRADLSVFRPSNRTWYFYNLANNQLSAFQFGQNRDIPVGADYDGDRKADIAVFRNGIWYQQTSSDGFTAVSFEQSGDIPMTAYFDIDLKADLAVFRPSEKFGMP